MITAKDHSSVQINVAEVDEEGKAIPGKNVTYALSGFVRREGEADDSINRLATDDGRESPAYGPLKFAASDDTRKYSTFPRDHSSPQRSYLNAIIDFRKYTFVLLSEITPFEAPPYNLAYLRPVPCRLCRSNSKKSRRCHPCWLDEHDRRS